MSFFKTVFDFVSGGIGETIVSKIANQFPDKMSEADKGKLNNAILQATRDHDINLLSVAQKEQENYNEFIKDHEGTASDLKNAGFIGKILLFLRGSQRPIWGFSVLYLDCMVFSGKWAIIQQNPGIGEIVNLESVFWIINLLVLGFLFGERAIRNVMPLLKNR